MAQVVGQHSLMLLEPAPHRARRRLLTPPFHGERLKAYGTLIQSIARQVFAELARCGMPAPRCSASPCA